MTNVQYLCYPRLPIARAQESWERVRQLGFEEISKFVNEQEYSSFEYYSLAKARAEEPFLRKLRTDSLELARRFGFPNSVKSGVKVSFDREMAILLHHRMMLMPNDASNNEVWVFINLLLLPDILLWRHGKRLGDFGMWTVSADRLYDMTRSTFGRLWWRVELLGDSDIVRLGEDECVQLMERPRIAGYRPLVASLVRHHVSRNENSQRMELLREVTKMITRRLAVLSVTVFDERQMDSFVLGVFEECEQAMSADARN